MILTSEQHLGIDRVFVRARMSNRASECRSIARHRPAEGLPQRPTATRREGVRA
jgi:hypothetical protein